MINSNSNIHFIIQARTCSTRLPNKIFKQIQNKPVLYHVINRLQKSKYSSKIIITTTLRQEDNIIKDFCIKHNIDYFRDSEQNVLQRYYKTAQHFNSNIIVRITSDCPLVDVDFIDKMIEYYIQNNLKYLGPKYFGNHKFPDGFNGEVFDFKTLKEAYLNADQNEVEHVSTYIIKKYKTKEFEYPIDYEIYPNIDFSNLHLSLDTQKDYDLIKNIFNNLHPDFNLKDVLTYLNENYYLINTNKY